MLNYFEVGFSLSALVIWLNFFIEKLFFSFYWANWISQKNPLCSFHSAYIMKQSHLVEWMKRHYKHLKYGQKNWPFVNLIIPLSSISLVFPRPAGDVFFWSQENELISLGDVVKKAGCKILQFLWLGWRKATSKPHMWFKMESLFTKIFGSKSF